MQFPHVMGVEVREHPTLFGTKSSEYAIIGAQLLLLLLALKINKKCDALSPTLWILLPACLAAGLARARYNAAERRVVRLWQLVGSLSAIYALFHYPLMPLASDEPAIVGSFAVLLLAWVLSVLAGIGCFRIPSLALLPPSFLLWSNTMAARVTGLPVTIDIDIQPLTEVSICIGLGLLVSQTTTRFWNATEGPTSDGPNQRSAAGPQFADLLLLIAIAVHVANYFWSFLTKMGLNGPPWAWLTENNPAYLFLVALDDGHVIFSGYPRVVAWAYWIFDKSYVFSNVWVLVCQGAAIAAFFLPRRLLIVLLVLFDVMHIAIIIVAGANFWPWIVLNVIVAVVVARPDFQRQPIASRLIATAFILIAPRFVQVTKLGWFDAGANNKLFFEAVDDRGDRYAVPTNFFTFYSYALGHMDYGAPAPTRALSFGPPNGGTWDYPTFKAGRACDLDRVLVDVGPKDWGYREGLTHFVRNYHRLALSLYASLGGFPYDLYPHHFYVPTSESEDFYQLDKRRIVAYIYRQESVCLSFEAGKLRRNVVATAEYRIDVTNAQAGINASQ